MDEVQDAIAAYSGLDVDGLLAGEYGTSADDPAATVATLNPYTCDLDGSAYLECELPTEPPGERPAELPAEPLLPAEYAAEASGWAQEPAYDAGAPPECGDAAWFQSQAWAPLPHGEPESAGQDQAHADQPYGEPGFEALPAPPPAAPVPGYVGYEDLEVDVADWLEN